MRGPLCIALIAGCGAPRPAPPLRSAEGATVEGRREGRWVFVDAIDRERLEGSYRAGRRHGTWTLYRDGRRVAQGEYRDGLADGAFRWWDAGGKLLGEARLAAGTGRWTEWMASPDAAGRVAIVDGECAGGLRHGTWTLRAGSAVLRFDRGVPHGRWRIVEDFGVTEGDFVNGRREGAWTEAAPAYWEMPVAELEARGLPHVPRDDEHLAEPDRIFRGEYRAGVRVGTWTVTAADGNPRTASRGELPRTIEYGAGDAAATPPSVPLWGRAPLDELGRCPVPADDPHGAPSELR